MVRETPPSTNLAPHHNTGEAHKALDEVLAQLGAGGGDEQFRHDDFSSARGGAAPRAFAIPGRLSNEATAHAQASPMIRSIIAVSHGPLQIELIG